MTTSYGSSVAAASASACMLAALLACGCEGGAAISERDSSSPAADGARSGQVRDADGIVSTAGLFADLSALESLTHASSSAYSAHLASSFDRAATSPQSADWFADQDLGQYVGRDGDDFVLLDTVGPGLITRVWSANPSGMLRIFLDDDPVPAVEASMADLLSGLVSPFVSPFAFTVARGNNLYFPIPFARHAKVTASSSDLYYQVNYRLYASGETLPSFADVVADSSAAQVASAALRTTTQAPKGSERRRFESGQPAWQRLDHARPGAITWLELRPEHLDPASLRGTMLELRFDGVQTVRVPLGDFFGAGTNDAAVDSLAFSAGHATGALTTRFVMPFHQSAELRITQATAASMSVEAHFHVDDRADDDTMLYFHASWTGPIQFDVEQPRDLTLLRVAGSGHYVGMVLNVANPDPQWWGEGDEKIYVDGETFPSDFGTGTEDYFGFGWCSTELFSTALVGQARANPSNNAGYVSLYRLHMLDRIPFTRELRFDLEALHWASGSRSVEMTYDAVCFWYGDESALDLGETVPAASFAVPALPLDIVEMTEGPATSC